MSVTLQISCLCGVFDEIVQTESGLPVKNITCSCNICRYCTGVLYLSVLHLKEKPDSTDKLREYRSSDKISRFFCGKCGAHALILSTQDSQWSVCTGAVERVVGPQDVPLQLEQYSQHEFIGDTVDGGLMICLAAPQRRQIPFFLQGPDEEPVRFEPDRRPSPFSSRAGGDLTADDRTQTPSEKLFASCHCGGVQYRVTRPNKASSLCSSPWPDLIVPSSTGHSDNPKDVKWFLCAEESKYLAGTCACRSCRKGSGVPIQTWAFIPKVNLESIDGTPFEFGNGSLQQYSSSPDVYREFCGHCGATAFWHCEERPDLIDVSLGLLRALEGSRAESWLQWWTKRVSFKEEALDAELVSDLESGLHAMAAN